jgi:hypothetical protein
MPLRLGTSKWNEIEQRLFSEIAQSWRGRPLESHAAEVDLNADTRTTTGLMVRAELDARDDPKRKKVSDAEMATLARERATGHGCWNYTIRPRGTPEHTPRAGPLPPKTSAPHSLMLSACRSRRGSGWTGWRVR